MNRNPISHHLNPARHTRKSTERRGTGAKAGRPVGYRAAPNKRSKRR